MTSTSTDRRDGVNSSAAVKVACRVATTANITLSGTQTIDGVAVVADDRVLVKNQTTNTENGIYVVSSGSWSRAKDFDTSRDVTTGTLILVNYGTGNARTVWRLTTTGTITFGSSAITFESAPPVFGGALSTVATIAVLKALTGMTDGQVVDVTSYYASATPDGGGGKFKYDSTSSATANDGTIIDPTAVGDGRWLRIIDSYVTPEMFGAKGDGSTSDETVFNTIWTYLNAQTNGATLLGNPNAIYVISTAKVLTKSNVTLDFRGAAITTTVSNVRALEVNGDPGTHGITSTVTNVHIRNVRFISHGSYYCPRAVRFDYVHNSSVSNVRVDNNHATDTFGTLFTIFGCRDCHFSEIYTEGDSNGAFAFLITSSHFSSLRNFEFANGSGYELAIQVKGGEGNIVANGFIHDITLGGASPTAIYIRGDAPYGNSATGGTTTPTYPYPTQPANLWDSADDQRRSQHTILSNIEVRDVTGGPAITTQEDYHTQVVNFQAVGSGGVSFIRIAGGNEEGNSLVNAKIISPATGQGRVQVTSTDGSSNPYPNAVISNLEIVAPVLPDGLYMDAALRPTLRDINIRNTAATASLVGVQIAETQAPHIENVYIEDATSTGMTFVNTSPFRSTNGFVSNVEIKNPTGIGFKLANADDYTVRGINVYDGGNTGIEFENCTRFTISGLTANDNTGTGVLFDNDATQTVAARHVVSNVLADGNGTEFLTEDTGQFSLIDPTMAYVQTTDATVTVLSGTTVRIPDGTKFMVEFTVRAFNQTSGNYALFSRKFIATAAAGAATVTGTTTVGTDLNPDVLAVAAQASGANVRVRVTGLAANTVDWWGNFTMTPLAN